MARAPASLVLTLAKIVKFSPRKPQMTNATKIHSLRKNQNIKRKTSPRKKPRLINISSKDQKIKNLAKVAKLLGKILNSPNSTKRTDGEEP